MPTPSTARPLTTPATAPVRASNELSDSAETPAPACLAQWTEVWRTMAPASTESARRGRNPCCRSCCARRPRSPAGAGNELSDAIERMAQGPRLADVVDFDRKLLALLRLGRDAEEACDVQCRSPHGRGARPAEIYQSPRYRKQTDASARLARGARHHGPRSPTTNWSATSVPTSFCSAQKELLQAATELRSRQTEIGETVSKISGSADPAAISTM